MTLIREGWLSIALCGCAAIIVPWWILDQGSAEPVVSTSVAPPGLAVRPALQFNPADLEGFFTVPEDFAAEASAVVTDSAGSTQGQDPPRLVGVVLPASGKPVALVVGADGQTVLLRPGGESDGWHLVAIGAGKGTFERAGIRKVARLDYSNHAPAASNTNLPVSPAAGPAELSGLAAEGAKP